MISLHTHSGQFCSHATDTLESIVQAAIKARFKVYGLSEHMPRFHQQHLYDDEEGETPESLFKKFAAFVVKARSLKEKYKDQILLLIGMETEFIVLTKQQDEGDFYINKINQLKVEFGLDYIVGSVHHVNGIPIDYDRALYQKALVTTSNSITLLYKTYFTHLRKLIEKTLPNVVAHFDLCRMYEANHPLEESVVDLIKSIIKIIVDNGLLVEINSRGWKKGLDSPYPLHDILLMMIDANVKFTLSDDSHGVKDVGLYYTELFDHLQKVGIKQVWYPSVDGDLSMVLSS